MRVNIMFQNIVIGKPLIEPWQLISNSKEEFEKFDKKNTLPSFALIQYPSS